jgi:hypothetical protein
VRARHHLGIADALRSKISDELQGGASEFVQVVEQVADLSVSLDELLVTGEGP